jgi:hypothetical protein
MTATHHAIKITIRSGGPVRAHFSCTAPEGSSCRQKCSRGCDSEEISTVCGESGSHDFVDGGWTPGKCNVTDWLGEAGMWDESYDGLDADVRSGPIEATWEGDYYTWDYAEVTA